MNATTQQSDFNIAQRLLTEAKPYWPHLGGLLLLELLATPLALLSPIPLKMTVDYVLGDEALPSLAASLLPAAWQTATALTILAVVLLLVTALLTQLQLLGSQFMKAYAGGKMVLDFRNLLFSHGQRLSLSRHDMKGVTDTLYRIQYDTAAIENIAIYGLIPIITSTVTVIAMVYVTFRINAGLALVALLVAPVLVGLTKLYQQPLREKWREQKLLDHAAMSVISEVFSALRVVKAFTQEEREGQRYSVKANEGLLAKLKVTVLQSSFDLAASLATAAGTAVVLFVGVRAIQSGAMTTGDLLIVMSYLALLYAPLKTIGGRVATLQNSFASAERAFSLLDENPEVPERRDALALERARGRFEFEGVSFAYEPEQPILRDVSLTIEPGTRVGIAGKTGAGKTTLINLLMRFYDPGSGRMLLDGVDLKAYQLKSLRRQFSLVLQDTVLFSTTIRNNIAYARPDATDEEILAAARSARAHEFIELLPEGYETLVGERGMRLSGGERQRIALARAFLRDAPVLVLDEPTSSVDVRTEASIMEAMRELMRNRTTFMIAHRLETLRGCDMLISLEGGRVLSVATESDEVAEAVG